MIRPSELLATYSVPSRPFALSLPQAYGFDLGPHFGEAVARAPIEQVHVCVYSNMVVRNGDIFGVGTAPAVPGMIGFIPRRLDTAARFSAERISVPSGLCSLHHSAHNFYHFMIDYLPNIGVFAGAGGPTLAPFVFSQQRHGFHEQAFQLLGLQNAAISDFSATYVFDTLALPSLFSKSVAVDFLRKAAAAIPAGAVRRVYVSRKNTLVRRVLNEDDILPILRDHGFDVVDTAAMSLVDQIALFKGADVVCGPHGAGLANLVFCREGTRVVELFLEERLPLGGVFWEIGCAAGLRYSLVKGTRVENSLYRHDADGDLVVDPRHLAEALSRLTLGRRGQ